MSSLCVVIPVFNHGPFVTPAVEAVVALDLPCILVDDGSREDTRLVLDELAARLNEVEVVRHRVNKGKGAAVMSGIGAAAKLGHTAVLQIDADGQHDTGDLPRFLQAAADHPGHLIAGKPRFDDSIPPLRYYGRYLTHVLVWIECLSTAIADTMCGYRVYPVEPVLALSRRGVLPPRMDFDTEVAVRLIWRGVPVLNLETDVRYPEVGLSNFRMFKDNVRLTGMHIRLLAGMLVRSPRLLQRRLSARHG